MSGTTEPWHLDKRVPIALILALVMQTAGMVWWAAGLTHRVDQHAREIAALASLKGAATAQRPGASVRYWPGWMNAWRRRRI
jgi:hypothetical protein